MSKLFFFTVTCLLLLSAACKKQPDFNDLGGHQSLQGTAVLYDTLNGVTSLKLIKNTKVYLAYHPDPANFIYSTTTNDQGQYTFSGIAPDSNYVIYTRIDTGQIRYYGNLPYKAGQFVDRQSDTLKAYPTPASGQNVLHLILQDDNKGRLSGYTAWVFNNPGSFAADSSLGHVFDMISNQYGVSNLYNIAANVTYYFRVRARAGKNLWTGEASITVHDGEVATLVMSLVATVNGVELLIYDATNNPIANAVTYFYRNPTILGLDKNLDNSLFRLTSNAAGFEAAYALDPATYYFHSIKVINKDTLQYVGNVTVGNKVETPPPVHLQ